MYFFFITIKLCSCNTVAATRMTCLPSGLRDRLCHTFFFFVICDSCVSAFLLFFFYLLKGVFFYEVLLMVIVGGCRLQCVLLAFVSCFFSAVSMLVYF